MYLHKPEEYKKKVTGMSNKHILYATRPVALMLKLLRNWTRNHALTDDIARKFKIYSLNITSTCLRLSEYVRKYATEEAIREQEHKESSSESSMSEFSDDEVQNMEL